MIKNYLSIIKYWIYFWIMFPNRQLSDWQLYEIDHMEMVICDNREPTIKSRILCKLYQFFMDTVTHRPFSWALHRVIFTLRDESYQKDLAGRQWYIEKLERFSIRARHARLSYTEWSRKRYNS